MEKTVTMLETAILKQLHRKIRSLELTSDTLIELLNDLHEYMDNRADCDIVGEGMQLPNEEMQFMVRIEEIKKQIKKQ